MWGDYLRTTLHANPPYEVGRRIWQIKLYRTDRITFISLTFALVLVKRQKVKEYLGVKTILKYIGCKTYVRVQDMRI